MSGRHIGEQHAIYTADESIWVGFYGAVPSVGDIVCVDEHSGQLRVVKVSWYIYEWLKKPAPAAPEKVTLSSARVLVEEVS